MKLCERVEQIIGAYDGIPNPVEAGPKGQDGFYIPSKWKDLVKTLVYGTASGLYRQNGGYFMDAGSGDGRVLALMSCFGFRPLGIELDKVLFDQSKEVIDALVRRGIIDGNIHLVNGDFNEDETYKAAGINFISIDHIFHGINSAPLQRLIQRITRESKPGTTLTVYAPFDGIPGIEHLTLLRHIQVGMLSDAAFYKKG